MRRDQLNDEYLELLDKQRLYFKTVKDFKEVWVGLGLVLTTLGTLMFLSYYPTRSRAAGGSGRTCRGGAPH